MIISLSKDGKKKKEEKERKDGMPKKHDPKKEKNKGERIIQERSSYPQPPHVHLLDQLVNKGIISMDPIFDPATDVIQVCAFILPIELHFTHLHKHRE